jgi:hypothetical protein
MTPQDKAKVCVYACVCVRMCTHLCVYMPGACARMCNCLYTRAYVYVVYGFVRVCLAYPHVCAWRMCAYVPGVCARMCDYVHACS